MSNMWILVISPGCIVWQRLQCWTSCANFSNKLFLPAMLIDTIHFYHFIPISVTCTLAGDHKVSAKQTLWATLHTFEVIRMKCNVVIKQFKLNILTVPFSEIYERRETAAVLRSS